MVNFFRMALKTRQCRTDAALSAHKFFTTESYMSSNDLFVLKDPDILRGELLLRVLDALSHHLQ